MTARANPSGTPSGPAGGSLTGTYPNPTIASGAVTDAKITGPVTVSKLAAGTPSQVLATTSSSATAWSTMPWVNVGDYGAIGDAKHSRSVTTASGSPIIHDTTNSPWVAGDVGKHIMGAGIPNGTTILSRQSSSQVTLSANATATVNLGGNDSVSGVRVVWYTQDDTTAITNAINSLGMAGGQVLFPGSGYVAHGLTLKKFHWWQGAGMGSTILHHSPGQTDDIVTSEDFASLTGTGSLGGVLDCGLSDITLDGNKDLNTSGGYCFRVYGANYRLFNVEFRYGHSGNWYSEFGLSDNASNNRRGGPEAHIVNVKTHSSDADGVNWRGPHDTAWVNVATFLNLGMGLHAEASANYSGAGLVTSNVAAWANGTYSINLDGTDLCAFYAFHSELASVASVFSSGNACTLIGEIYPGTTVAGKGLVLGDAVNLPSGNRIDVHITGYTTGATQAMDLTYSGGQNMIKGLINIAAGTPYTLGSNQASDAMWINCTGGGGPSIFQVLTNTNPKLKGRVEFDNYGGTGTGATNFDMEGQDTLRQTMQMLNASVGTSGRQSWYLDWAGSGNTDIGAGSLGFRNDHSGSQVYTAILLDTGGLILRNDSATPGTPTGGGVLYVESGALKYKGSGGTVTTLGAA